GQLRHQARQSGSGPLHQVDGGNALILDRPGIRGPHLGGLEKRVEPARKPCRAHPWRGSASATAPAVASLWVSETAASTRSASARAAAAPDSRTSGAAALGTTSMSRKDQPRSPSA